MLVEPSTLETVRAILTMAIEAEQRVLVVVRSEQPSARPPRSIEGTPVFFEPSRDGQERVVLEVAKGATLQKIVVGRIERVLPAPA